MNSSEQQSSCVSDDALLAFLDGKSNPEVKLQITNHLESCSTCQERIESLISQQAVDDIHRAGAVALDPSDKSGLLRSVEAALARLGLLDVVDSAPRNTLIVEQPPEITGYQLLERIDSGGMGIVWLANETGEVRRKVAIKVIQRRVQKDEFHARFRVERQALASMEHENIARFYRAGETTDGKLFFAMEYVPGAKLLDYCNDHSLDLKARMRLFVTICRGVQHAHVKGVIHRDLKPSNILIATVDKYPVAKIIDFGLAKNVELADSGNDLSLLYGQVVGVLRYTSPEQVATSVGQDVDTRADIYSLGVILYELLTGDTPITKTQELTTEEILTSIRELDVVRPSERIHGLSKLPDKQASPMSLRPSALAEMVRGDLDWIALKTLEKDRERRYQTASALAADIERHLSDQPIEACPPSKRYLLTKAYRRHWVLFWSTISFLALLVLAIIGTTYGMIRALDAERSAKALAIREADARKTAEELRQQEEKARNLAEEAKNQEAIARKDAEKRLLQIQNANHILADIFEGLDPRSDRPDSPPLREIMSQRLEEGARRLQEDSVGSSLDVAGLQLSLGKSQLALGYFKKAIPLMESCLATVKKVLGQDHVDTLTVMNHLAAAYEAAGQLQNALDLHRKTYEIRLKQNDPPDLTTLLTHLLMANLMGKLGDYEKSLRIKEDVTKQVENLLPAKHPQVLAIKNNLAVGYFKSKQFAKAIKLWEELLPLQREIFGAEHQFTLGSLGNLAMAYGKTERHKEALAMYEEVVDLTKKQYSDAHPKVAHAKHNLGLGHFAVGDTDKAIVLLQEASRDFQNQYGDKHPSTLESLSELAEIYLRTDRKSEARKILLPIIGDFEEAFGKEHPSTELAVGRLLRSQEKSE